MGNWVPGGRLEAGESVAAGAARELAEETGVVADPADLELLHVAHHAGGAWEPGWVLLRHQQERAR